MSIGDGLSWGIGLGVIGAALVALRADWYDVVFPLAMMVAVYGSVPRAKTRPGFNGVIAGVMAGLLPMGVYLGIHGGALLAASPGESPQAVFGRFLLSELPLMVVLAGFGTWLMVRARQFAEEQRRKRQEARKAARAKNRRHKKKKK
ncbi:MAG: hypothetical protein IRY98_04390 [Alicyclobacillaceae bacterium]|nr:hypothetical protein [Alicyclobacillaceae bacterium]